MERSNTATPVCPSKAPIRRDFSRSGHGRRVLKIDGEAITGFGELRRLGPTTLRDADAESDGAGSQASS